MHYRPKRRLQALLELVTTRPSQAVREIRQREEQWEEEESQHVIELLKAGRESWPGRPNVLAYCGLEETRGVYLVHEAKNADHDCRDFSDSLEASRGDCSSCLYRTEASGPERDRRDAERLIEATRDLGGFRPDGSHDSGWHETKELLNSRAERIDNDKATDMLLALDSGEAVPHTPLYYDTCRQYSSPGHYVLCRVRNYHGHCPGYSGSSPAAGSVPRPPAPAWQEGGTF
jgi:hypothetical protein